MINNHRESKNKANKMKLVETERCIEKKNGSISMMEFLDSSFF